MIITIVMMIMMMMMIMMIKVSKTRSAVWIFRFLLREPGAGSKPDSEAGRLPPAVSSRKLDAHDFKAGVSNSRIIYQQLLLLTMVGAYR